MLKLLRPLLELRFLCDSHSSCWLSCSAAVAGGVVEMLLVGVVAVVEAGADWRVGVLKPSSSLFRSRYDDDGASAGLFVGVVSMPTLGFDLNGSMLANSSSLKSPATGGTYGLTTRGPTFFKISNQIRNSNV